MGVFRALEGRKAVDGLPGLPLGQAKLVETLKIKPEFRARAEKMGEAEGGIARDRCSSMIVRLEFRRFRSF